MRKRVGNPISFKQRILYMLKDEANGLQVCGRDYAKRLLDCSSHF